MKPGEDPEADALAGFLSAYSAVPEAHSLAKGTAPAAVRESFSGWTGIFRNEDPITVAWFCDGVPSTRILASKTLGGVMGVRFRGARTAGEADYVISLAQETNLGCGFVVYEKGLCPAHCVASEVFTRCLHFWGTRQASEVDAERGYRFWREAMERDGRPPYERWAFEGDHGKRLGGREL